VLIGCGERTFGEGKVVDGVEQVCLAAAIQSYQNIDPGAEIQH
jgi:hypothetical protein